jgi:hypothetical protein
MPQYGIVQAAMEAAMEAAKEAALLARDAAGLLVPCAEARQLLGE